MITVFQKKRRKKEEEKNASFAVPVCCQFVNNLGGDIV
jgi:hypothetical protein